MALRIRLARGGAKKRPFYRIVVAENTAPRDGKFVEKIGTYNPLLKAEDPNRVVIKKERVEYWLSQGAKPSDRVAKFFGQASIIPMPDVRETPNKSKPKAKAQERLAAAEEAKKAAAEAAEAAAEEAKAAAEAPAEAPAEEAPAEEKAADETPAEVPAETPEEVPAEPAPAEVPAEDKAEAAEEKKEEAAS